MHKGDLSHQDLRENTTDQATGWREKTYNKDPKGWNDTRVETLPCLMPGVRGCAPSPAARRAHAQLLVPQHLAQPVCPRSKVQTEHSSVPARGF